MLRPENGIELDKFLIYGGVIMSLTFKEMQEMYKEIVKRFNQIELQEWKAHMALKFQNCTAQDYLPAFCPD